MIGNTLAHYKVLEKIGEGGMGVVYKAEDTKLKRTVALKFLPSELTRDAQARARFVQEAQAAAALDHPHICAVFEIGEAEGATYIAMPYVKGRSLKERIAAGPLSMEEALDIAGQVAEGLKEAHQRGIIHRDIKPANIMLTEKGQAKIMDFGLAKLEAGVDLTRTMAVIGTVAYMSPEQARGEEVDCRTDIWSVGATLYEMLTGQKPFGQKHDQALLYSILNDTTESVSRICPEIPKQLDRVIQKALEKDKSRRYQNMAELLKDLKSTQVAGLGLPKAEKSIVVLPFENISPDPEQEYFCDGMTEEIITDLSRVHDLLVISRSSAMTFKDTKKTIPEIARAVNVRYVLEGSVRKAGNSLRITAQLIDSETDAHLWAEKYSGTLDDVFDIQEKVSRSIAEALKLRLTAEEKRRMAERSISDVTAYEYYLRAYPEILNGTEQTVGRAVRYLQNALDIVGDNALIYSYMAFAYWMYVNIGARQEEYRTKAEEYVKKSLAQDPTLGKAHVVLGWIKLGAPGGKFETGLHHFKKGLEFSPEETWAWQGIADIYIFAGRISSAIPICEKLLKLDPLDFHTNWIQAALPLYDGRFDEAVRLWLKLYETFPEYPQAQLYTALALAYSGKNNQAFEIIDKSASLNPDNVVVKLGLMLKAAIQGDAEKAHREATPEFRWTCRQDGTYSHNLAGIFAMLHERTEALDWLENAVDRGVINYPFLAEKDSFLDNIRGEPRFQKLMQRVKSDWEHFEV